jgi:hypothetical protein
MNTNKVPPEQLLAEVNDLLRTMPPESAFLAGSPEVYGWTGRAAAVAHAWDVVRATTRFDPVIPKLNSKHKHFVGPGISEALIFLNQVRHDLSMRSQTALGVNVGTGLVFDYFDEVRKAIEMAKQDLLFIDPYLDAEFVSRYLPHVSLGVTIRLLARERINTLLPSVSLIQQQANLTVEVRSASGFHDRYVIVDRATCFQSGASFKDGAKKAPTTLTQIIDAFPAVLSTYEALWTNGVVQK